MNTLEKKKKRNMDPGVLGFALVLIPFFKPVGIASYPLINRLFQISKILSVSYALLYIIRVTHFKLKRAFFWRGFCALALFQCIYVINSFIRDISCGDLLNNCITDLVLLCWIYTVLQSGHKIKFISALHGLFSLELALHLISFVLAEAGYCLFEVTEAGYTYLFGRDNYSAFATLPMLGVVLYTSAVIKGKHTCFDYLLTIGLTVSYVWVKSVTAALAFSLLLLALIARRIGQRVLRFLPARKVLLLLCILLAAIIFGNVHLYFLGLTKVMGKGADLNSRTIIWEFALKLIRQRPVLGWGTLSKDQIANYALYGTDHTHNLILEVLLRTGMIGACGYLYFLLGSCKQYQNRLLSNRSYILVAAFICFLVLSMMDVYPLMQAQYCMYGLLYGGRTLEERKMIC